MRCSTSVGTRMVGSTWRMSISAFIRVSATAAAGLAPMRRYVAHQSRNAGSRATLGARSSIPTGPPQFVDDLLTERFALLARRRPRVVGARSRRA